MRLVGEQLLHKTIFGRGENCAQGQCCCAYSLGRGEENRGAQSHQLATVAAQGPAGANAPFREENPQAGMKPQGLVSKAG